jgi:uncharacterized RDD family membrane protein YckC
MDPMLLKNILESVVFISMPVLLFIVVYIGHMDYAGFLEKCGFGRREVGLLLIGGLVGIILGPLGLYAVPLFIYESSLLAVDLGGAIIPVVLSIYLIKTKKLNLLALSVVVFIISVLTYMTTEFIPSLGVVSEFPFFLFPSFCALGLTLIIYRDNITSAVPFAYASTTLGVLIGADIVRIPQVLIGLEQARVEMDLPIAAGSIGGAGGLDLVFLSGLLAMAPLFFLAPRALRHSKAAISPSSAFQTNLEKTLNKAEILKDKGDFNGALYTAVLAVDMKINDVGFKFKINQSPYVILDMVQIHPYTRNDYWLLVNSSKSMYKSEADTNRGIVTARYIIRELEKVEKKLYATLPQRVGAFLIDLAIIFGILMGFFAIGAILRLYDLTDILAPETMIWLVAFILWLWIAQAIYFTILEGLNGQTIGKKVVKIKVTTDEMTKCSFMDAFTRNVLRLLDTVLLLYTVSFYMMIVYPKKQRIGDKVAKTIVLKV